MPKVLKKTIEHPDELHDAIQAEVFETNLALEGSMSVRDRHYREGLVKGLEIARSLVEAHTFIRYEGSDD